MEFRTEKDVLGEVKVPVDAYWGANTQRAIENFNISGKRFPTVFILSLAELKKACVQANRELKLIKEGDYEAILAAIDEIILEKKLLDQFPVDVFQSGSGTQTNMNMNEVLANRANEILGHLLGKKYPVHPNDHINMGQSSNDVIPSAMHISTIHLLKEKLIPALDTITSFLGKKIREFEGIIKVGRTHLQDAVPIPLVMEFDVYRTQLQRAKAEIKRVLNDLSYIPIGGTAVGTGLNTHGEFASLVVANLTKITEVAFKIKSTKAEDIASHNTLVQVSSRLRSIALSAFKMANDIRWMGSGPRAGLSELILPQNEPGSSIMPGKINPTQSEMLIQVAIQVIGNDATITQAEAHGSILDLNVCKPLMIYNLLESIELLSNGITSFAENCLSDLKVNEKHINSQLDSLLMTITRLTPIIGYDKCAQIAQKAYREGKTIKEVILEEKIKIKGNLDELLDPKNMVG
ncbi:MAG: class II fumarate hydratase [Promethearchaeota archaeon]|nr:MAG: class II fumarate hydratase [Candidatus Lokiarchaeota archaeon]